MAGRYSSSFSWTYRTGNPQSKKRTYSPLDCSTQSPTSFDFSILDIHPTRAVVERLGAMCGPTAYSFQAATGRAAYTEELQA